jgi:hypothetical protein
MIKLQVEHERTKDIVEQVLDCCDSDEVEGVVSALEDGELQPTFSALRTLYAEILVEYVLRFSQLDENFLIVSPNDNGRIIILTLHRATIFISALIAKRLDPDFPYYRLSKVGASHGSIN